MKQMIIMIAMILLGIGLAGFILSFSETAESMSESAKTQLTEIFSTKSES